MPLAGSTAWMPSGSTAPGCFESRPLALLGQRKWPPLQAAAPLTSTEYTGSPPVGLTHVGWELGVSVSSHRAVVSQRVLLSPPGRPPEVPITKYEPSGL